MSYVVINALTVPEGMGGEIEKRFAARKHAVDSAPGFEGFKLLRPVTGDDRYFVYTQWKDEESYAAWRDGDSQRLHAHGASGESNEAGAGTDGGDSSAAQRPPVAMKSELLCFDVALDSTSPDSDS